MLRITGRASRACDRVDRRELMRLGALSLFPSVTLPRLLEAGQGPGRKLPQRAKSVVLLNLFGGPSHIDMFDLKPDAPSEVRGEFNPIDTSLAGLQICEHLPKIAGWMDRASLIRTITHNYNSHHPYTLLTGYSKATNVNPARPHRTNHPSMGSLCSYLGVGQPDVVPYVFMPAYPGYTQNPRPGGYAGYLGGRYDPLFTECEPKFDREGSFYDPVMPVGAPLPPAMQPLPQVTLGRLNSRESLRNQVQRRFNQLASSSAVETMSGFQRQAYTLLTSGKTRDAFDLSREPARAHERYGRHLYGQCMLTARRLVEAGTTFVAVNWEVAVETHGGHWDTHSKNFEMLRFHLPMLDQICTALVHDLDERGLLDSTLFIVTGEMGRTPKVTTNAGRNHWPQCGFCLLAGGGTQNGMVYGETDKHAGYPVERPVSPGDLVATIYSLLGIDPQMTVPDLQSRPIHISHGGEPIHGILA